MKIEDVKKALEPFKTLISITEDDNYITVKPQQYISDKQKYSDIGKAMYSLHAEYVTTTKPKQWRILKAEAKVTLTTLGRLDMIIDELTKLRNELK